MAHLAGQPVSEAVYAVLLDAALATALPGGVHSDVPEDPTYPFAWYEIFDEVESRGFGTGSLPLIDLRVHVFSQAGSLDEAQAALLLAVSLLKDAHLTVTGWTHCGTVFYDRTIAIPDSALNGVKVHELVAMFRAYVEA